MRRSPRPVHSTRCVALVFAGLSGVAAAVSIAPAPSAAQVAPSPLGQVVQNVSGTEVSLEHFRPSVRGRLINGGLVPHGEFWTPSANYTTKMRFSKDVTLAGHEVSAGAYGLWIEGSDSTTWRAMLIADTAAGHGPHLQPEDGLLVVPAVHEVVDVHQETLLLQIDSIRASGAVLRMHWGTDRISIPIGVDHGVRLTVPEEDATPLLGQWRSLRVQVPEETRTDWIARWIENGETEEDFEAWYRDDYLAPETAEFEYRDGMLVRDSFDDGFYARILIPRGPGFFAEAMLMGGELAGFDEGRGIWEFFYDESGRAVRGELRNGKDELTAILERP